MPIIARFILAAEAALFQTLLEEKGIPSTLLHSGTGATGINNTATASIDVPAEHAARALAVYADYSKDTKTRADTAERAHPNKGFPFFTVWVLFTVAIMLFYAGLCLPSIQADADATIWICFLGTMFLTGAIGGLVIAFATAFLRMIPSVLKRKTSE